MSSNAGRRVVCLQGLVPLGSVGIVLPVAIAGVMFANLSTAFSSGPAARQQGELSFSRVHMHMSMCQSVYMSEQAQQEHDHHVLQAVKLPSQMHVNGRASIRLSPGCLYQGPRCHALNPC